MPIYVHAKILIADDRILRIGSSNVNNRSMRLDTECDLSIDAATGAQCERITVIRNELLAEHLGVEGDVIAARVAETGSLIGTIEAVRGSGKTLQPYALPELTEAEKLLVDNELLDPEGPEEMFEPLTKRSLFRGLSFHRRKAR